MIPAKICGMTRVEDALLAAELGASAIGFVFYEKSPRYIRPEDAAKICEQLPAGIARVGVFANPNLQTMLSIVATVSLTHVQLCGEETPSLSMQSPLPIIKSVRSTSSKGIEALKQFPAAALLVDSWKIGQYGGTGKLSDWNFCRLLRASQRTILAGGISSENVESAILNAKPDAVDLCSSVEESPGKKDHQKLRTFFNTLKTIDDNHSRLSNGFLSIS